MSSNIAHKSIDNSDGHALLHNLLSDPERAEHENRKTKLGRFLITLSENTIEKVAHPIRRHAKDIDFEDPASVLKKINENKCETPQLLHPPTTQVERLCKSEGHGHANRTIIIDTPPLTPPNSGVQTPRFQDEKDVWAMPEWEDDEDDSVPWRDLCFKERLKTVIRNTGRVLGLLTLLYFFICSLGLLSDSFKLLGGKTSGKVFRESALLQNPVCGLMIGVFTTVLLQSSSTSTSIVVGLVASNVISVSVAIPIVMGANVGTSMTNTLVALGHSGRPAEFRRAFAAATVHDMFNWLCVLILLPIEIMTGYLNYSTKWLVGIMSLNKGKKPPKLLKHLTEPFTKLIVQLDKSKIKAIAQGDDNADPVSLVKRQCALYIPLGGNSNETIQICSGSHIFGSVNWSDSTIGFLLLGFSLFMLIGCLLCIVHLLHAALKGQLARTVRRFVNNDLPRPFQWLTGYVAIMVGCVMTILVQSSSIVTSALTPLVAVGVLSLDRMYPLTLGANIGTTFTSILAALASDHLEQSLQIALCHLMFNISGILLFYVVPKTRKIPIGAAKILGQKTAKYRWVAVVYVVLVFIAIPLAIFGLSIISPWLLLAVGAPLLTVLLFVLLINFMQINCRERLPSRLKSWSFLPRPLHSLAPYDRLMTRVLSLCPCSCAASASSPEHNQGGKNGTGYEPAVKHNLQLGDRSTASSRGRLLQHNSTPIVLSGRNRWTSSEVFETIEPTVVVYRDDIGF